MPLEHIVLRGRRAIFIRASGVVTPADHERLVSDLLNEEALEEGLPVLIDGRGIESTIGIRDLPHVVTLTRMLVKRGMDIIAIVADPGPILVLARAFEIAARTVGVHVAVFEDILTARVWLGLRQEDLAGVVADSD
jgi:hypothetical protein